MLHIQDQRESFAEKDALFEEKLYHKVHMLSFLKLDIKHDLSVYPVRISV